MLGGIALGEHRDLDCEEGIRRDYTGHAFSLANGAKDVRYGAELLTDSETGNIMSEALDRYYTHQLNKYPDDTLLSRLLVPEKR